MVTDSLNRATDYKELEGKSTDVKPTEGIGVNSKFTELDTNDKYYFDGTQWAKIGGA